VARHIGKHLLTACATGVIGCVSEPAAHVLGPDTPDDPPGADGQLFADPIHRAALMAC
jgi:hypothetical protein